jgi:hypothetical protein
MKIDFSKTPQPKCQLCGKPRGDHKAQTFNCPIGTKHRTYSYTQFDQINVYVPKPEKASK